MKQKEEYNELIEQLLNGNYKRANFTVYNFIENDGYVNELSAVIKYKFEKDDFEYLIFNIGDDKKLIKKNDTEVINKYKSFKAYIEKDCQDIVKVGIFIMEDIGVVFAVKPFMYDISKFKAL